MFQNFFNKRRLKIILLDKLYNLENAINFNFNPINVLYYISGPTCKIIFQTYFRPPKLQAFFNFGQILTTYDQKLH